MLAALPNSLLGAQAWLQSVMDHPWGRSAVVLTGFILVAVTVDVVFRQLVRRVVRRTASDVDDRIIDVLHRPVSLSIVLCGIWYSLVGLGLSEHVLRGVGGLIATAAVVVWTLTSGRLSRVILQFLTDNEERYSLIRPRTLPMFEIGFKVLIIALSIYFLLLSWKVDVTAWLASAGVLGVVVGLAAQETLGSFFAGITILAEAPYKLGDFLVLPTGERGRVTEINMRSTRILTDDAIEVIIPNSLMASSKIVNESGGPSERERVRVPIGVGYNSELKIVREALLGVAWDTPHVVLDDPGVAPAVRFVAFGDSSLDLELHVWIDKPELRPTVLDALNTGIFHRLGKAGIEIPFPKRDVYLYPQAPSGE